jgi:hypothetical protein
MGYYTENYPHLLPEIWERRHGERIELIDLSQDIPKLMEYIQEFDKGTAETLKTQDQTLEFGFYWEQLNAFIEFHPYFDCCTIPNKELQQVLNGLFSDKLIREKRLMRAELKRHKNLCY